MPPRELLPRHPLTCELQRRGAVVDGFEVEAGPFDEVVLDDEDDDSFADLISKGVAEVGGGAWRREQDGHWRFWQNPDWSPPDEDY